MSAMRCPEERAHHSELLQTQTFNAKFSKKHLLGAHLLLSFGQLSIQRCASTPKETFRINSLLLRGFQAAGEVGTFFTALTVSSGAFFQAWLFLQAK